MNQEHSKQLIEFKQHCQKMSENSDSGFAKQFGQLKRIKSDSKCLSADLPANKPKNRLPSVKPYDHSRVKLQLINDKLGSDYINANYITRDFIITQGPMSFTRDDFWRHDSVDRNFN